MNVDPEILALNKVFESLRGLNQAQIRRIINWLKDKFGLDLPELMSLQAQVEPVPPQEAAAPADTGDKPVKKRRGRGFLKESQPQEPAPEQDEDLSFNKGPSIVVKTALTGFHKFESLEDVFKAVKVRKGTEKILIAAAFLQEGRNYKELSSYDISSSLKAIGQGLVHVSGLLNSLIGRTPAFLVEIGKYSSGQQGRRKFRVTEEGLKAARGYIE